MTLIPSKQLLPNQNNLYESELIQVKVKLFALYQEKFGQEELELQIPSPITVIKLLDILLEEQSELQKGLELIRFGVNCQFVPPHTLLKDGDEVVFIPPVSGG